MIRDLGHREWVEVSVVRRKRVAEERPLVEREVLRIQSNCGVKREPALLALEEPFVLELNGEEVAVVMRLSGMEKELAVGFCLSEGLVATCGDLLLVEHCGRGIPAPGESPESGGPSRNRVRISARPEGLRPDARLDVTRLIRAGCGRSDAVVALDLPVLSDGPRFAAEMLLGLGSKLREAQLLHRESGGLHAAALFDTGGNVVCSAEDVGRHNALDKVAGHCLLRRIPLDDKVGLCSGRLSYEMAAKAVRLGLPLLMSVTAPTALAVETAEACNLTLVGYVRGSRMTVYCHPDRVIVRD